MREEETAWLVAGFLALPCSTGQRGEIGGAVTAKLQSLAARIDPWTVILQHRATRWSVTFISPVTYPDSLFTTSQVTVNLVRQCT